MRHALTLLRRALTVVAFVCLGGWTTVKLYAYVSTVHNQAVLEQLIRERRQESSNFAHRLADRSGWRPVDGTLLGRIDVPRLGVSALILQGSGERWLEQAAGHIPETPLPGDDGNAAIAGHRDSVFSGLKEIRLGDSIEVTTPWSTRLYRVDDIRIVDPNDTSVLAPSRTARVTLITCYPFHYIGSAPRRFVVQARAFWSGSGAVVVPPRPVVAARLQEGPKRRPGPVHRAHALTAYRTAPHALDDSRLPARRALTNVSPPSPARSPKLSWWRRLFHLPPKRPRGH